MGEATEAKGLKIVRPGTLYYFDDQPGACPMCNSNDLEYRCRVEGTPRTAQFKCTACQCKFEKTRMLDTEPEGYVSEAVRRVDRLGLTCKGCGADLDMSLNAFTQSVQVVCTSCGVVLKSRTGQQA